MRGTDGEQLQFGDDARSVALKRAWERALHILAGSVNRATYESHIRSIQPVSYKDGTVTLGVASAFGREWLVGKGYIQAIRSALEETLSGPLEIRFSLIAAEKRPLFGGETDSSDETPRDPSQATKPKTTRREPSPPIEDIPSLPFNARYTFENFIVGKSNRLAQAGAIAVATSPGDVYNPLFMYGGPGLGKTHLMHAIAHEARRLNPALRLALIDGETFTQHYVTSLREHKTDEFRRQFRSVDIWLVDDIQFIAGREQTKEEFFHTFNALYQTGKQIVISSDRSPRELRMMDERLRSRFESGLISDINSPELETRVAILERRCEVEKWKIPNEVIYYIASAIQSNIRALEGAMTKLVAYSSIMKSPHSIELAQSVLGEYFIDKAVPGQYMKTVPPETILRVVAEHYNTSREVLLGKRRDKEIAIARQTAMYLCRDVAQMTHAQIGAAIGGRDHTTVQRAVNKIDTMLPFDPRLRQSIQEIRRKLDH